MTAIPSMRDLERLLMTDPLVRAAWVASLFAGQTHEQALIGVILALHQSRQELLERELQRLREERSILRFK